MSSGAARWRLGLSAAGAVVSVYLTLVHYTTAVPLVCPAHGVIDCAQVLTSPQSVLLGLPLGLWGLLWFLVMGGLTIAAGRGDGSAGERSAAWRRAWVGVGAVAVVYFIYLELLVIGKICLWCTSVHVLVLALLLLEGLG